MCRVSADGPLRLAAVTGTKSVLLCHPDMFDSEEKPFEGEES